MKTFRIETERSHDCDECRWGHSWSERRDDWGYESFSECKFEPSIKKYMSEDSACAYDDVITFNDDEEKQIIDSIRDDDGLTVDIIEEVIDNLISFNDFCGNEDDRRQNIFEYVMDYYERRKEDK